MPGSSSTASTTSAAAARASTRRSMGVVPAWLAAPAMVTSRTCRPVTPVTTPTGTPAACEHGALLDVELDEGVEDERVPGRGDDGSRLGVAAGGPDALGDRGTIVVHLGQGGGVEPPGAGVAAGHAGRAPSPLLVGEGGDDDAVVEVGGVERRGHLDGGDDAVGAVVGPGVDHRVEVTAGGEPAAGAAGPAAEEVGGGVDGDVEPGLGHPAGDDVASRHVLGRPRLACHPAARRGADPGQRLQSHQQPVPVDPGVTVRAIGLAGRCGHGFRGSSDPIPGSCVTGVEPRRKRGGSGVGQLERRSVTPHGSTPQIVAERHVLAGTVRR